MKKHKRIDTQWGKRAILLLVFDIIAINLASFMALMIRFDFSFNGIPAVYLKRFLVYMPVNTILTVLIFYVFRMYHSLWVYASINELWNIAWGSLTAALAEFGIMSIMGYRMPYSYNVISLLLMFIMVTVERFSYRLLRFIKNDKYLKYNSRHDKKNVMIIGAGEAGKTIADEIRDSSHVNYNLCCFIDDMKVKQGRIIAGIPVAGNRDTIAENVKRYEIDIIFVAIPSISNIEKKKILDICKKTKCELRILPGVYQLVNGDVTVSKFRKVDIEDLLGREPIKVNINEIIGYVNNKVVMVTGGGGSIGSELCRQLAAHGPRQLIIVDIYENNAYDIQQELRRKYPDLDLVVLIASVRNTHRINDIFAKYHPDIVYHAAAHKHVPLMEDSPNEAIKNNVFGTYKTAMAAAKYGTKRFVLISTDKAVNPTSVMGASKRICEMIIQMLDKDYDTEFVAVRFGNVLGSNGSVIPLFRKQIEDGGPVTVTHPDIVRFFMTIPEAVSLVLQAGAYAKGGEIFVLDMGDPVKIDDLARNLIRLSGFTPDVDIKVEYTGLRPGEKLYEEILMNEEGLRDTENQLIHIGKPIEMDEDKFREQLDRLKSSCERDDKSIKNLVSEIVPTYKASGL